MPQVSALPAPTPFPGAQRKRSEYVPYDTVGSAHIAGTGDACPSRGVRRNLSSRSVMLAPATTWSRKWWERWVLTGNAWGGNERRAAKYLRKVTADSSGRFEFGALPAGRYFVTGSVLNWSGRSGRPGASMGLVVMGKEVTIAPGEHLEVRLDSLRADASYFEGFSLEDLRERNEPYTPVPGR